MLELLNQAQLARALDMAPQTLQKKILEGLLEAHAQDGKGRLLFSLDDLDTIRRQLGRADIQC